MIKKSFGMLQIVIFLLINWSVKCHFGKKICDNKDILKTKKKFQELVSFVVPYYLFKQINYYGKMINCHEKGKINVVFGNHLSTLDFLFMILVLDYYKIHDYYFVMREGLNKNPIFRDFLINDIKVYRDWDKDKEYIVKQLNNITSGTIIIYLEGTRYNNEKKIESFNYCYQNRMPLYNYTLTPKVKGIHAIVSTLRKNKKLGKVYDITFIATNFINKTLYTSDIVSFKDLGPLEIFTNEITFDDSDMEYNKMKKKIYFIWFKKNLIIDKYAKHHMYKLYQIENQY